MINENDIRYKLNGDREHDLKLLNHPNEEVKNWIQFQVWELYFEKLHKGELKR